MIFSGSDVLSLLGAVLLAALGGELFLKGVIEAAVRFRVPKLMVATTLAAFATSSPEFSVSIVAALAGTPEIGLGDALGSNVVNIALIFGLALLCGPLRIDRRELSRNFFLALAVPPFTFLLVWDGLLSRREGAVLLLIFLLWLGLLIRQAGISRPSPEMPSITNSRHFLLAGFSGLVSLVIAGKLFVSGATGIASAIGIDGYVVGATLVAIGTSMPELVTVLLSRLRGHDDISVGTLLGSNLFNGLAVTGLISTLHPVVVSRSEIIIVLGMGLVSLLLLIPGPSGLIGRRRGLLLIHIYALFAVTTLLIGRAD